jgi:Ca2+-transporting ATPase
VRAQGAAEIVLERCTGYLDGAGAAVALDEPMRAELDAVITGMASRGLRTLCLALRELPRERGLPDGYLEAAPDDDLTLCAIVGIKARPRAAPDAAAACFRNTNRNEDERALCASVGCQVCLLEPYQV